MKNLHTLLTLTGAITLSACAVSVPEEDTESIASQDHSIKNADELHPSLLNAGTVRVEVWGPGGKNDCSGQVISRDSVLTAAHCFYDVGFYASGWNPRVAATIRVTHQNPNGSWETLSRSDGQGEGAWVSVREEYVDYANAGDALKWGYDVAVLQRETKWNNVVQSDASAFVLYPEQQMEMLMLYGHGLFDDQHCPFGPDTCDDPDDDQLRMGTIGNLVWHTSSSDPQRRTIDFTPGPVGAQSCLGDSGGPWKKQTLFESPAPVSGVVFGVHVGGQGMDGCSENLGFGASVSYHDTWIRDRVQEGRGSCSKQDFTVPKGESHLFGWTTIPTRTCW